MRGITSPSQRHQRPLQVRREHHENLSASGAKNPARGRAVVQDRQLCGSVLASG